MKIILKAPKFRRRKSARITIEFVFLASQKFVTYKILNTLNLFWLTIDSSVLPNVDARGKARGEGVRSVFHS